MENVTLVTHRDLSLEAKFSKKGDEVILKVRADTIDQFDKLMEDLTKILAPRLSLLKEEISKRMEVENAPAKTQV